MGPRPAAAMLALARTAAGAWTMGGEGIVGVGIALLVGLLTWLLVGAVVGLLLGRLIHVVNPSDERWPDSVAGDHPRWNPFDLPRRGPRPRRRRAAAHEWSSPGGSLGGRLEQRARPVDQAPQLERLGEALVGAECTHVPAVPAAGDRYREA
jgi:hypothetical protein